MGWALSLVSCFIFSLWHGKYYSTSFSKKKTTGIPWWHRGERVWWCHSSGSGHPCGVGLIPGRLQKLEMLGVETGHSTRRGPRVHVYLVRAQRESLCFAPSLLKRYMAVPAAPFPPCPQSSKLPDHKRRASPTRAQLQASGSRTGLGVSSSSQIRPPFPGSWELPGPSVDMQPPEG